MNGLNRPNMELACKVHCTKESLVIYISSFTLRKSHKILPTFLAFWILFSALFSTLKKSKKILQISKKYNNII